MKGSHSPEDAALIPWQSPLSLSLSSFPLLVLRLSQTRTGRKRGTAKWNAGIFELWLQLISSFYSLIELSLSLSFPPCAGWWWRKASGWERAALASSDEIRPISDIMRRVISPLRRGWGVSHQISPGSPLISFISESRHHTHTHTHTNIYRSVNQVSLFVFLMVECCFNVCVYCKCTNIYNCDCYTSSNFVLCSPSLKELAKINPSTMFISIHWIINVDVTVCVRLCVYARARL